ncbi:MAG: hypothetical protein Q7U38_08805 [Methylobacter sp.]|nr:hypothetical protein [Methylobacter sp.]MDP2097556.1 hypothetical protein [Methylobacter sp.]MDP2429397.1 hypothetical protein [Methylobacter sp.]MDP3053822.1 hypothetical protein [Methylobacter sp.]MDP3362805.1 hypothetical protein [Methylobacter sp.]
MPTDYLLLILLNFIAYLRNDKGRQCCVSTILLCSVVLMTNDRLKKMATTKRTESMKLHFSWQIKGLFAAFELGVPMLPADNEQLLHCHLIA